MDETTVAYLAGLIDGEGYIGIKKARRPDSISPIYHERIQVRMVHEGAIRLLADTLGGNYYLDKPHAKGGRQLYCWQASDALAARILTTVLPYLIVKRDSALMVLGLRANKDDAVSRRRGSPAKRVMAPAVVAERERLYLAAKALNHAPV